MASIWTVREMRFPWCSLCTSLLDLRSTDTEASSNESTDEKRGIWKESGAEELQYHRAGVLL